MTTQKTAETTKIAPYGTWNSPLTPEKIASGSITISELMVDGDNTFWIESRPTNKGNCTIVRLTKDGKLHDVTPPDFNSRSFVHEYGGKSYTVINGTVYSANGKDNAIYTISPGSTPKKLTQEQIKVTYQGKSFWKGVHFGDLQPLHNNIVAVCEEFEPGKTTENSLAFIDTTSGRYHKIATGHDFYAYPAISKDQKHIAWITWDNPQMPWTNTQLWTANIDNNGILSNVKQVAGTIPESIMQPQWSPDRTLYFVTDRDKGWWNLHRYVNGKIENVCPIEAEVGEPLWVLGRTSYSFLNDNILFAYNSQSMWHLALLDPKSKQWHEIARPAVYFHQLKSGKDFVRFIDGYADNDESIMQINAGNDTPKVLHAYKSQLAEGYISKPQHISFPSAGRTAYGLYYPPRNQDYKAPQGQKPPLIIMIHGGPTSQAKNVFQIKLQFWTTRGFAVLDVNYGGSTGYGRHYRGLLDRNWGIVDVEDCINGAKYLVDKGLVDGDKLAIRGGSAGGYTTLAVLTKTDLFKAGASFYGVADITVLAHDTHKFEAEYMEELVGKYPEEKDVWIARSPITNVDKIKNPLIIFQGEDDAIVPKNQSVMIYEALKARGIPVELYLYANEGHGFRQAATISDSLQKELDFYLKVFGLKAQ